MLHDIIKKYVSKSSKERREAIADEIFQYIEDYYEFCATGKEQEGMRKL